MESNYDPGMLLRGRYPESVKRRIAGDLGHLSNDQAAGFLDTVAHDGLQVVVGHVSEQNNHPELLEAAFAEVRSRVASLDFATQQDGIGWVTLEETVRT
jgi:phosphoribosyl 1,2-cyclic phosphodiesterase